mmetsp:Transcript_3198/g.7542  ORF Transcript_3198/g.7542 Transcript_3198/m.7542 type:complete len:101 (-) Transcript_3198:1624-1926(-)|eukprot:g2217.t1
MFKAAFERDVLLPRQLEQNLAYNDALFKGSHHLDLITEQARSALSLLKTYLSSSKRQAEAAFMNPVVMMKPTRCRDDILREASDKADVRVLGAPKGILPF